jgi:hypothetical protein
MRASTRRRVVLSCLCLSAALALGARCESDDRRGEIDPTREPRETREPLPAVVAKADAFRQAFPTAAVSYDAHTGYVESLSGFVGPEATPGATPEQSAIGFMMENAALFGIDPAADELEVVSIEAGGLAGGEGEPVREVTRGYFLRVAQTRERIRVFGATASVSLTNTRRVYAVANDLVTLASVEGAFELSQEAAIKRARAELGDRPVLPGVAAERTLLPLAGVGRRAWNVGLGQWRVVLDAANGEVLLLRDEAYNQTAVVFSENATVNGGSTTTVPIGNLGAGATTLGDGTRVAVANAAAPLQVSPALTFNAMPGSINFDDQMVYFHMDGAFTFFNGFVPSLPATPRMATTNLNAIAGFDNTCNAFYNPPTDTFGFASASSGCTTCASTGADADVIVHETTHRVLTVTAGVTGRSDEAGAIHEGTGDYFAATIQGNSCLAEGYMPGQACLRDVGVVRRYPSQMDSEPHAGGAIWGSTLWRLRRALGKQTADRVIMEGMRGLPADPRFSDFAGNIILNGSTFYMNLLGDDAWKNFFLLIQVAAVLQGAKDVFCAQGIAAPYGTFTTGTITTPGTGATSTVTLTAPPGQVVDSSRGCRSGFDITPISGSRWLDVKQLEEARSQFSTFTESLGTNSLTVTIGLDSGCSGPPASTVRYVLYHKAP